MTEDANEIMHHPRYLRQKPPQPRAPSGSTSRTPSRVFSGLSEHCTRLLNWVYKVDNSGKRKRREQRTTTTAVSFARPILDSTARTLYPLSKAHLVSEVDLGIRHRHLGSRNVGKDMQSKLRTESNHGSGHHAGTRLHALLDSAGSCVYTHS